MTDRPHAEIAQNGRDGYGAMMVCEDEQIGESCFFSC